MQPFELTGADGKRIKGDYAGGTGQQILVVTQPAVKTRP